MEAGISKEVRAILSDPQATRELYDAVWSTSRQPSTIDSRGETYTLAFDQSNNLTIRKGSPD